MQRVEELHPILLVGLYQLTEHIGFLEIQLEIQLPISGPKWLGQDENWVWGCCVCWWLELGWVKALVLKTGFGLWKLWLGGLGLVSVWLLCGWVNGLVVILRSSVIFF